MIFTFYNFNIIISYSNYTTNIIGCTIDRTALNSYTTNFSLANISDQYGYIRIGRFNYSIVKLYISGSCNLAATHISKQASKAFLRTDVEIIYGMVISIECAIPN